MRLLLVEDEPTLAGAVLEVLRADAYAVDHAADGQAASELTAANSYDLILLDWTIPPPSGIKLLRAWRAAGSKTPVLMLTGRSDVAHKVDGLDAGADDYLTKPFSLEELLARVRSLLRRRELPLVTSLSIEDVVLERASHQVTVRGESVDVSPKEFALLEYLMIRANQVVSRTELIEHVWDESFDSFSNVVDVTIHRLRKKIDDGSDKKLLHTVKGIGYVLHDKRC